LVAGKIAGEVDTNFTNSTNEKKIEKSLIKLLGRFSGRALARIKTPAVFLPAV